MCMRMSLGELEMSAWLLIAQEAENISHVKLNKLTKFHSLIAFTCVDIGYYVYCNYLFSSLWRHKFWSQPYFSNQAVGAWTKSQYKNFRYLLRTERAFKVKWAFFIIFKWLSIARYRLRPESPLLKYFNYFPTVFFVKVRKLKRGQHIRLQVIRN